MADSQLADLDFSQNRLLNARLHPAAGVADPNFPVTTPGLAGQAYYDTVVDRGMLWSAVDAAFFRIPRIDKAETVVGTWNFSPPAGSPFTVGNSIKVVGLNSGLLADQADTGRAGDTGAVINTVAIRDGSAHLAAVVFNASTGYRVAGAATSGNVLRGNGANFVDAQLQAADIGGGQALTRVDDTNVTLTLGGSPTTALLAATSITVGWTGLLSLARGGSNANLTAIQGGIVYSTATAFAITAALTGVLIGNGTGVPTAVTGTDGRVPFWASNTLTTDADLSFSVDTLTATKLLAPTSVSTPSLISTTSLTITPLAGSNLNVVLSTTGDFVVNTNQIYVDTSAGSIGVKCIPDTGSAFEITVAVASQRGLRVINNSAVVVASIDTTEPTVELFNPNTTNNSFSRIAFTTHNTNNNRITFARVVAVTETHAVGGVSGYLAFYTQNVGVASGGQEWWRISAAGIWRSLGAQTVQTSTGVLTLLSDTRVDINAVCNATTGFRVANAATSGNVLRGNGTNFVSAQLQAGDLGGGAALTRVDDTNVTLTLGGSPTTALLAATSITVGWTGTLAAARLNANVVQSVVNDTNVTGSIAAQVLTLGWTGTLAAARLNANVVQSVVNDTNVTGSIAAQVLTIGWTGQTSIARGGHGQTTAVLGFNALSPLTTRGDLITRDATNNVRLGIGANTYVLTSDGTDASWQPTAGGFTGFANPTASVGLTAVNGVAVTAMRSDAAPPIDQAIAPVWTSAHTWRRAGTAIQADEVGDSVVRYYLTTSGGMGWGPGNAIIDTTFGRTASGVLGLSNILDVATGFRVAGGATAANYLRGDGTNFVSSAIQAADIPDISGTYVPTTRTITIAGTSNRVTSSAGAQDLSANRTWTLDIAATYVGQTSITTLGTVTTGTWNAGIIPVAYGGTNLSALTANGVLYASSTSQVASGSVLTFDGSNLAIGSATAPLKLYVNSGLQGNPVTSGTTQTSGTMLFRGNDNSRLFIGERGSGTGTFWIQVSDITSLGTNYPLVLNPNGGNVGVFTLTPSTALDVGGVVNALTGFRVATAATSGNVLRGNGTNFVSAQLAFSDISGVATVAQGGTNVAAFTANGVLYASSTSQVATSANLTWNGSEFSILSPTDAGDARIIFGAPSKVNAVLLTYNYNANTFMFRCNRAGSSILFHTGADVLAWTMSSAGVLQSNGAQTIQTSSGVLTLLSGTRVDINAVCNATTGFRVANAATSGNVLRGNGTNFVSAQLAYSDLSGTPTVPVGANPTASVGLSAVNGSAVTFMRSDGAPPLDVTISPTWTGTHTWQTAGDAIKIMDSGDATPRVSVELGGIAFGDGTSPVDTGIIRFGVGLVAVDSVLTVNTGFRIANAAASSAVLMGNGANFVSVAANTALNNLLPSQGGNAGEFLTTDGTNTSWAPVSGTSAGNPTASVGLSVVNGVAVTFMRSDGAPALSQSIAPVWTSLHTWRSADIYFQEVADTDPRLVLDKSGILFGSGAAIVDTTIVRTAAGILEFTNVVNALTGFRVAGGAASGNVLRGNATNFVSAQLSLGDCSAGALAAGTTSSTPSTGSEVANKSYVDTIAAGGVITASVTSTGTTVATLWSYTVAAGESINVFGTITGRQDNGDKKIVETVQMSYSRDLAGSTGLYGTNLLTHQWSDSIFWSIVYDVSGNDVRIRVVGNTGEDVNWVAKLIVASALS